MDYDKECDAYTQGNVNREDWNAISKLSRITVIKCREIQTIENIL